MKKIIIISTVLITCIGAFALFSSGILALDKELTGDDATSVRPVKTMKIQETRAISSRSFPGVVKAASEAKIAFRVSGPIETFPVSTGQFLKKGALIARMDSRDYEIQIKRIKAGIREASAGLSAMKTGARDEDLKMLGAKLSSGKAQLEEARLAFERFSNLLQEKAVSQMKYDHAKASYEMAQAAVTATKQELAKATRGARQEKIEAMEAKISGLKASLRAARNALEDTTLTMPFDGYISGKYAENHETVKAGMPVVTCIDTSSMELTVGIPEDFAILENRFESFNCRFDTYPGETVTALLKQTGEKAGGYSKTYPLTVIMDVPDHLTLKAGMAATLSIGLKTDQTDPTFFLPVEAVFSDSGDQTFVWVIDPAASSTRKTRVSTGKLTGSQIEITDGLETGNVVATAGVHFLKEGQKVKIENWDTY